MPNHFVYKVCHSGERGSKRRRILKVAGQNQTRPICNRVRSPPNITPYSYIFSVCSAMNFTPYSYIFSPVSGFIKFISSPQPTAAAMSRSSFSEKLSRFILWYKLAGVVPSLRASSASVIFPFLTSKIRIFSTIPI